ncbi:hypothetical protein TWF730_007020 [Orbilia blumenaviensis]|uniref:Uncharacterized protein n=1 Tax=Orbilia blumenaviensis TaxID=1796055 RepID=A0AAV9VG10_9PEZI
MFRTSITWGKIMDNPVEYAERMAEPYIGYNADLEQYNTPTREFMGPFMSPAHFATFTSDTIRLPKQLESLGLYVQEHIHYYLLSLVKHDRIRTLDITLQATSQLAIDTENVESTPRYPAVTALHLHLESYLPPSAFHETPFLFPNIRSLSITNNNKSVGPLPLGGIEDGLTAWFENGQFLQLRKVVLTGYRFEGSDEDGDETDEKKSLTCLIGINEEAKEEELRWTFKWEGDFQGYGLQEY